MLIGRDADSAFNKKHTSGRLTGLAGIPLWELWIQLPDCEPKEPTWMVVITHTTVCMNTHIVQPET